MVAGADDGAGFVVVGGDARDGRGREAWLGFGGGRRGFEAGGLRSWLLLVRLGYGGF